MLERLLTRRATIVGAQILAGVVAAVFSLDFAHAQSPAAFGVYNRANSLGSGGFGGAGSMSGQAPQGINAFNAGGASNGMSGAFGSGSNAQNAQAPEKWEAIEVDAPEYIYRGHDEKQPILSVKFLSFNDGADYAVLSASGDKTARLWALEGKYNPETTEWFVTNGRLRKSYKDVHKQGITSAIFSPDYSYVLTSSYDGIGRLWNFGNQENIRAYLGAKDRLWAIDVAPSGEYVAAACNDGCIYFWESLTVKKLGSLPNRNEASKFGPGFEDVGHEGPVFDVAFSPDSEFVATAGADGTIRIWNLGLQKQVGILKGHTDKVYSVVFSEDGGYILSASRDKTARLWNPATGEEVCRFVGHTGAVRQAVFAGSYVATASDDGTSRLWSMQGAASNNSGRNDMGGSMGSGMAPMSGASMVAPSSSFGSSGDDMTRENQPKAKPTRKAGKPKGTELARFNVGSPTFTVDVTDDSVYLCTGSADGVARIWRVPGNSRRYGDSGSNGAYGNGMGSGMDPGMGTGFGTDPMADPNNVLK